MRQGVSRRRSARAGADDKGVSNVRSWWCVLLKNRRRGDDRRREPRVLAWVTVNRNSWTPRRANSSVARFSAEQSHLHIHGLRNQKGAFRVRRAPDRSSRYRRRSTRCAGRTTSSRHPLGPGSPERNSALSCPTARPSRCETAPHRRAAERRPRFFQRALHVGQRDRVTLAKLLHAFVGGDIDQHATGHDGRHGFGPEAVQAPRFPPRRAWSKLLQNRSPIWMWADGIQLRRPESTYLNLGDPVDLVLAPALPSTSGRRRLVKCGEMSAVWCQ